MDGLLLSSSSSSSSLSPRKTSYYLLIVLVCLLLVVVQSSSSWLVSGSSFKFESELYSFETIDSEASSSSSSLQWIDTSLSNNENNIMMTMESETLSSNTNNNTKEANGVALFTYSHESSILKWEILSKASNFTYEQSVEQDRWFVLAHSDYVNETNAMEYWDRNETTRRFIVLG